MNRTTFWAAFLIMIGVLGTIVGIINHHITSSVGEFVMYVLPIVVGVIILIVEKTGK